MVHDSPPQNGVAERGMRTRAERAQALLLSSGLPCFLWEEAMKHSTWLQNIKCTTRNNPQTCNMVMVTGKVLHFSPYFTFTPPPFHYDYSIPLLQGHMAIHNPSL